MFFIADMESDLMDYCLFQKGKWWANHFFRNREVNDLYGYLRRLDLGTIIAILGNGGPDYKKHIRFYEEKVKPMLDEDS